MTNENEGQPAIVNRRAQKAAADAAQAQALQAQERAPAPQHDGDSALDADIRARRKARQPFGSHVQKLAYPARPGYYRHWFNDEPGRIDQAILAAYSHVKDERTGKNVSRPVGTAKGGGSMVAYLMEIPRALWDEDMRLQQEQGPDKTEQAIRRAKPIGKDGSPATPREEDRFYSPTGVKLGHSDRF